MYFQSLRELTHALARKQISSVEITQIFLDRITRLDPQLNSFITVLRTEALQAAKTADAARAKGHAQPLTGVPIAHKDNFCTQGIRTSCASRMLDSFIAPYDATLVKRLKTAGTVLLGKLNMDEFAMGSSSETSFYGAVKNPWDTERVPGGSSGGSSAAVAAGLTVAATGSDTGGSIRQPAALCNLVGLKPTYGRVSRYGMVAFASSLDQAGVITRTAEDAALLMNAIAGFDEQDSTSVDMPVPDYTATLHDPLKGLTIGIPQEYFSNGLDPEIAQAVEQAIQVYQQLGATIKTVSLKNTHQGIALYYLIASAECASNLSRYDGVRYGYRCQNPQDLEDLYKRSRSEGFGSEVKRRILIGTYVLSSESYNAYYLKAQTVRTLLIREFAQIFENVDLLLGPTLPTPAFKLGEKMQDPIQMYLSDIYTVTVNLAGLPALSLPAGFTQNGLPIGMQLIGPTFSEARLLNAAHLYQSVTDWHTRSPAAFTGDD
jgi:aspartyl-tRNA(Asn)/glutamyl-tRNA(Gln) amidotransferase subunit A